MTSRAVIETFDEAGVTRVSRWIWNCYVIHAGPIVVDAGLPSAADDIAPVLTRLGGRVAAVVATHGHSDHLAGAPEVARRYDAPIHLPERTLAYLDGARARNPGPRSQARVLPVFADQPRDLAALWGLAAGTRRAGFGLTPRMRWNGANPAAGLRPGDHLPGAPDWTVLAAAGHTDDSVAFWHAASGTLLGGDAVLTRGGRAWFTPEFVDAGAAAATNGRLRGLPVRTLLPGHGAPVRSAALWAQALPPG